MRSCLSQPMSAQKRRKDTAEEGDMDKKLMSRFRQRLKINWLALMILLAFLTSPILLSCGGGGGGGGGGIDFTGNSDPAAVNETNSDDLAVGAINGADIGAATVVFGDSLSSEDADLGGIPLPIKLPLLFEQALISANSSAEAIHSDQPTILQTTISDTIPGPCGGSLTFTLVVNETTGEFSGTFVFTNYCDGGIILSGSATIDGSINPSTGDLEYYFITFNNLSTGDLTITGDVSLDATVYPMVIEMDYLARDNNTGKVYWVNDYTLLISEGFDYVEADITGGRFYDHDHGYVDIYTPVPLIIYDDDEHPTSGVLVCVGANNAKVRLTCIDNASFQLECDADGNGTYEINLGVFYWEDSAIVPGLWSGPADFGEIEFLVAAGGSTIETITLTFDNFSCGGATISGSIGVSQSWSISNSQFSADLELDASGTRTMNLQGTFASSGSFASGTFTATINSTDCSGIWQAAP
jgi:hypothetical protein